MKSLVRIDDGSVVASSLRVADTFTARFAGLMGKKSLPDGEALLIPRCAMVHMFFMRFPLDVLFCSAALEIIDVQQHLHPWRVSKWVPGAACVIELAAGKAEAFRLQSGTALALR